MGRVVHEDCTLLRSMETMTVLAFGDNVREGCVRIGGVLVSGPM